MDAYIKRYNNRPTIFIDDLPYAPVIYSLTDWPGGRLSYEESTSFSIKRFAKAGVKLFQLDINFEDMWKEDDSLDISIARAQIKGITDINPDAAVFFRLHTNPPIWWYKHYPDEWVRYANTQVKEQPEFDSVVSYMHYDQKPVPRPSFASKLWKQQMSDVIVRFLNEMQNTPEASNLAGIHMASGLYGEHHNWAFVGNDPDMSKPMLEAFREYTNNENAQLPDMQARYNPKDGIFRDPVEEQDTIRYFDCMHNIIADTAVHFCKLVKENWKSSQIITGVFYCYYVSLFGRAATGGHLAEQKVLSSPYIDYISAPQGYSSQLREVGGPGAGRSLIESARLNNKLLLDEMDHPTHLGTRLGGMKVYPEYESLQILRRNALFSFINGMGFWYYDFGPFNTSGFWNSFYYQEEVKRLQHIFEKYNKQEFKKNADVLLVFDTQVQKRTALSEKQDPMTDKACINLAYPAALRSGACVDSIYLSDIEKVDMDKYKCVVFMNTFYLTDEQKTYIHKHVNKNDRNVVWFYAPGYTDGAKNEIAFIEQTTGISMKTMQAPKEIYINVPKADITYSLNNSLESSLLSTLFIPDIPIIPNVQKNHEVSNEAGNEVSNEVDNENKLKNTHIIGSIQDAPAFVKKEEKGYTTWYSSIPFTSPDAFRYVFDECGVHIYSRHNDAVAEGSGLLCIHAEKGGERSIEFLDDVMKVEFADAETILFDTKTKQILLRGEYPLLKEHA